MQGRREASPSSQYLSFVSVGLEQFSARHTSQTHLPEEGVFQRLSSQLKLNLTIQPTLQARHSSPPSPVTPLTSRQMEPDAFSHHSMLTRARREEGNYKTETTAPLKSSE